MNQNGGSPDPDELSLAELRRLLAFSAELYSLWHTGIQESLYTQAMTLLVRGYAQNHGLDEGKTAGSVSELMVTLRAKTWVRMEMNNGQKFSDGMITDELASSEEGLANFIRHGWRQLMQASADQGKDQDTL